MKSPQPAVSVCMPVYNASRYLRECIDSVLSQTFVDFEFLIVDDGSDDDSAAIVESYADPRIRLIRREHGYIASLNCLLDEARGRYIARMDADDVMLPDRLRLQFDYMEAHPDVDVLGGGAITIDEESKTKQNQEGEAEHTDWQITLKDLVEMNRLTHPTVCMRMETLRRLNASYEKEYIYAEDYRLWSALARESARIMVLSVPVLLYRESSGQVSARHYDVMRNTAQLVSYENRKHLAELANQNYIEPAVAESERKLTVIIPFLNEGEEVVNTVACVREFAGDTVDIIVINDFSYDGIDYGKLLRPYGVYYYVNFEHKGVAASRDFGVERCRTSYFLLLDAHMRFYEAEVFKTITEMLDADDRQLLCCQSTAIIPDPATGRMVPREDYPLAYGAYCIFAKGNLLPIIEWCDNEHRIGESIEEIPMVLGAAYAMSRRYWSYIGGLLGLKGYGFDEPYLSYKVWREGGKCVLIKKHVIGHLYRERSPYFILNAEKIFNSLLICRLTSSTKDELWSRAYAITENFNSYHIANTMFLQERSFIDSIRKEYQSIYTRPHNTVQQLHFREQRQSWNLFLQHNEIIDFGLEEIESIIEKEKDYSIYNGLAGLLVYLSYQTDKKWTDVRNKGFQRLTDYVIMRRNKTANSQWHESSVVACIGWLFIFSYLRDVKTWEEDSMVLIDSEIASYVNYLMRTHEKHRLYDNNIRDIICYCNARISSMCHRTKQNTTDVLCPDFLMSMRIICQSIINHSGYDMYTYYHALTYEKIIVDNYDYIPSVSDLVSLPSNPAHLSTLQFSISSGRLGYLVLRHIITEKLHSIDYDNF